jgi:hypothetical protein
MKLRDFLNQIYDETWVFIKPPKGKTLKLWMADYIGYYEPVMKDIEPYLDRDIVDEVYTTIEEDPEIEGDKAAVICVELCSAKESKRRSDGELLDALIKAVREYDNLRDREWDFETDLPNRDMWPADTCEEYATLLKDIEAAEKTINKLMVEATGDKNIHL